MGTVNNDGGTENSIGTWIEKERKSMVECVGGTVPSPSPDWDWDWLFHPDSLKEIAKDW
jgi:hypothetical protein